MKLSRCINILLVDGSKQLVDRYCTLIDDAIESSTIYIAHNTIETIDIVAGNKIDIVFVDVYLKDGLGLQLLKTLKKISKHTKVVVLTDWQAPFLEEICSQFGADYFFEKSIDFEKITSVIQEVYLQNYSSKKALLN